jgi:hypothetical protein
MSVVSIISALTRKLYQRRVFIFVGFWTLYFGWFWSKALTINQAGDLVAGHVNIWGDWAVHLTMTTAIAQRGVNISSPILINAPFAYPFFINAVSALLLKLNVDFLSAMILPSLISSIGLVLTLLWSFKSFFKSWNVSLVASLLFLLSGGLGFLYLGNNLFNSEFPLRELVNPSQQYTRIDEVGIKWINVIDSMIIPQRSFALGFSLAIIALTLLYEWWLAHKKFSWKIIVSGLLLGLLPIIHTYAFLASFLILSFWSSSDLILSLIKNKASLIKKNYILVFFKTLKPWLFLAVFVGVIATPLLFIIGVMTIGDLNSLNATKSLSMLWGWLAGEYHQPWWFFALQNWGVLPIVALFGLVVFALDYKSKINKTRAILIFTPFFLIFILANIVKLQPYTWDNTKFFIWSHFAFSGLGALALSYGYHLAKKVWLKKHKNLVLFGASTFALSLLFAVSITSGTLDAYRILRHQLSSHVFLNKAELSLAEWAINNSDPNSVWLTGDQHNHWLFTMTGRQPIMAYRGWLWTHGYNYQNQERAVSSLYINPKNYLNLLKLYQIDFVVIGPNEKTVWKANESAWMEIFPVIHQNQSTKIFSINQTTTDDAIDQKLQQNHLDLN